MVKGSNSTMVNKIQRLLPMIKVYDCHKLKAVLQDLKRAGKLDKLIQNTHGEKDQSPTKNGGRKKREIKAGAKEELKGAQDEAEVITPNKVGRPATYYAGVETLKGRKRKSGNSFKRVEALNKKGWGKAKNQMKIDKFLVPKKKKTKSSKMMMMASTDSFS